MDYISLTPGEGERFWRREIMEGYDGLRIFGLVGGLGVGYELVELVDVVEEFVAANAFFGGGDEDGGEFFPAFEELGAIGRDVFLFFGFAELVGFGEHNAEGHAVFAKPVDELHVDFLRSVTGIDEHEKVGQLLAVENVVFDDSAEFFAGRFVSLSIAIAGEVDDIPTVVDEEVVDEHRFAGSGGCHGETVAAGEHIDERGFAYV